VTYLFNGVAARLGLAEGGAGLAHTDAELGRG
jgi:hypothetical protein